MYMRDPLNATFADSNHYALPLPFSPVIRTSDFKLIRIDILPTGVDATAKPLTAHTIKPPNEYTSEHQQLRTDLKPLNVVQPEGVSFKSSKLGETGEVIEWQKWAFKVGFNAREGMIIYDVSEMFRYTVV
jgi:primary-amine oxidase